MPLWLSSEVFTQLLQRLPNWMTSWNMNQLQIAW